ncbi:MAG: di-trans,poly-cis-decaprenylcistransferase [Elusimicrobiota bacterium]|jgi:undecaprenyl diphosphate synthase|nr:di-trans,poly-cis-decaprenylcistransferase [Elusimicrobiota bacterium]
MENKGQFSQLQNVPVHVGFIMDGNGRWAAAKNLPREAGHREGAAAARAVAEAAKKLGIKYITLYAFSTENWRRPPAEIAALMSLLEETLDKFAKEDEDGVRLLFSGRREGLASGVLRKIDRVLAATAGNKGLVVNLAINYGGRQEIADAFAKLAAAGKKKITEADISASLYQNIPEPDLIIRTSCEMRLSNFLLWQAAYIELYFTDVLWPDFREPQLMQALVEYGRRERRYGRRAG